MRDYKVWFNDAEAMKNRSIKVKAMGIVPAIEEAQRIAMRRFGLKFNETFYTCNFQ